MKNRILKLTCCALGVVVLAGALVTTSMADGISMFSEPKKITPEENQALLNRVSIISTDYGDFHRVTTVPALDPSEVVRDTEDVNDNTKAIKRDYGFFVKQ